MKKCPKCGELVGDNAASCFNCFFNFNATPEERERVVREQERVVREQEQKKLKEIREKQQEILSINDQYEYDVVIVSDSRDGYVDTERLKKTLNEHGKQGWRLVNAYTNELGVNRTSVGVAGFSSSTNATVDANILVFERCVHRFKG